MFLVPLLLSLVAPARGEGVGGNGGSGFNPGRYCGLIDNTWILAATDFDIFDVEVLNETVSIHKRTPVNNANDQRPYKYQISENFRSQTIMDIKWPSYGMENMKNVAKGKPAYQTSTFYGCAASRAVDGNTNGDFHKGAVTHTNYAKDNSWHVDLMRRYYIDSVNVFNREDCCRDRLEGAKLLIDGKEIGLNLTSERIHTFKLHHQGQKVQIFQPQYRYLTLAEVEVFGSDIPVFTPVPFYDEYGFLNVNITQKEKLLFGPNTITARNWTRKTCVFDIPPLTNSLLSIQQTFRTIKLQASQYWVKPGAKKCYADKKTTITMVLPMEPECVQENKPMNN